MSLIRVTPKDHAERIGGRVEVSVEFKFPAVVDVTCPSCATCFTRDLEELGFSNPAFGKSFREDFWCPACEGTFSKTMIIDLHIRECTENE